MASQLYRSLCRRLAHVSSSSSVSFGSVGQPRAVVGARWMSQTVRMEEILANPGKYVEGLTAKDVANNPALKSYLEANFVNRGGDLYIHPDDLKSLGMSREELIEAIRPHSKKQKREYGDSRVDKGLGNAEQQALNIRTIKTYVRASAKKRVCEELRSQDIIPGMLYGRATIRPGSEEKKQLIQTPYSELQRELDRFHRNFESRVYDLTVYEHPDDTEGTVYRVLPRDVQRHPVKETLWCANFLLYHYKRPIKIPVRYINTEESAVLRRDGFIIPINRYIECRVSEGAPIPEVIDVDCTGLGHKDVVKLDRAIFPDGVKLSPHVNEHKFIIGPVRGGRGAATADDAADAN